MTIVGWCFVALGLVVLGIVYILLRMGSTQSRLEEEWDFYKPPDLPPPD